MTTVKKIVISRDEDGADFHFEGGWDLWEALGILEDCKDAAKQRIGAGGFGRRRPSGPGGILRPGPT